MNEREARAALYGRRSGLVQAAPGTPWFERDIHWMSSAVALAQRVAKDEWPFGCIVVGSFGVIGCAAGTGSARDPTAHSEIRAIRDAVASRGRLLVGCTLYSTHEPCIMCCGATNHAKVSRVVWGSYRTDVPGLFRRKTPAEALLAETSHPPTVRGGVLRERCIQLFEGATKWD